MRRTKDFTHTVHEGRRAGRATMVVHLVDERDHREGDGEVAQCGGQGHDGAIPLRVGFVVSRAVGSAVTRNRVRRRLRHLLRARMGWLPNGGYLVVRALPKAAGASWVRLERDLDAVLLKVTGPVGPQRTLAGGEQR